MKADGSQRDAGPERRPSARVSRAQGMCSVLLGFGALVTGALVLTDDARPTGARLSASGTAPEATGRPGGSTTAPPTPSSSAPDGAPAEGSSIGFIGCSQALGAVRGYVDLGGTRFWPVNRGRYSGGTVARWAETPGDNPYFRGFNSNLRAQPTSTFWWQLCTHPEPTDEENYMYARTVLDELRARVPDAAVYVSSQNGYIAPHACDASGPDGPARMQALADRLVAEGLALAGPDVGDLRGDGSAGEGTVQTGDGCHPNTEGQAALGAALRSFPAFRP